MPSLRTCFRPFPWLAALLVAATATAGPASGQEFVLRAFGDSITDGYGDTSSLGGYPARLERRLRQEGYDVVVTEHGVGGETTLEGLSRIDSVLALGGDYLLLMEGTNDISQRVSLEAIRFNLDEMAMRAEALGFGAVHGTVIPRIPTAPVDGNNARTFALAEDLLELGVERWRAVADVFNHFETLPNLYEDFYYYGGVPDPVGHPNNLGYIEIAGVFLDAVRPLLDGPQMNIVAPPSPGAPGAPLSFAVATNDLIDLVEWSFGDGGVAISTAPPSFAASYVFESAGSYTVTATGHSPTGGVVIDTEVFTVVGATPAWSSRTVLIPAVSNDTDGAVVSDLRLGNVSVSAGLADVTFLPDIRYDDAPATLRLLVPAGGGELDDLLSDYFGVDGGRGGLVVDLHAIGNSATLSAEATLRAPEDIVGSAGCATGSLPESGWTSTPKQIFGVTLTAAESATVHLVNPGEAGGSARLDLYDGLGSYVGSGLFDLAPGAARLRDLDDLFRGLNARPQPFSATFSSSGIPYSAFLVVSGAGVSVRCFGAAP